MAALNGHEAVVEQLLPARWLDSHLEHSQRHLEPPRALEDVPKTLRGSGTNSCEGGHEGVRVWGARGGPEARSCRALSRLMGRVRAVSQAQAPPNGPTRAIYRRAEH